MLLNLQLFGSRGQGSKKGGTTVTELAKNPQEPLSAEESSKATNPNFKLDKAYRINCQTCVLAYELNRRGVPVEATGNYGTRGYNTESYKDSWFHLIPESAKQEFKTNSMGHPLFNTKVAYTKLEKAILATNPEGARGILKMNTLSNGHVVNYEISNGKVVVYDPQVNIRESIKEIVKGGARYIGADGRERISAGWERGTIAWARMDNKEIVTDSDLAREYFKVRKTK